MARSMKIVVTLLTLVTVGMIMGALFQLAYIRKMEESSGAEFPSLRRTLGSQNDVKNQFPGGVSGWANDKDAEMLRLGFVKPEVISWAPRIIVLHKFLSMKECDHLKAIAKPRLSSSTVVDTKTGKGITSRVRTSSGMFLNSAERKHPTIQAIEKRIAVYSQVPAENGELLQVLRYEKDQFYRPHHDYFSDTFSLKRGGQRIATMLMYLTDNVEGGETIFPMDIFGAGTETSASTIEWAIAELTKNPHVISKLRSEVFNVVGENTLKESDIPNLAYLQAFVKEILRLHPPTPLLLPRRAVEECNIMGYTIPKDCQININAWAIGRDPQTWDDPLSFSPERFLNSSVDFKGNDFELIPFGGGRRICPGFSLATQFVSLIVGSLVQNFEWTLPNGMGRDELTMDEKFGLTLQKDPPLHIVPKAIQFKV